jgi:hypothetical protein
MPGGLRRRRPRLVAVALAVVVAVAVPVALTGQPFSRRAGAATASWSLRYIQSSTGGVDGTRLADLEGDGDLDLVVPFE